MDSLVIGYGNDLRSDDGAGRAVADRVDELNLPGVAVRSVMQLTPELALEMAEVDTVVFVDASVEVSATTAEPVTAASPDPSAMSHYTTPATLLGMTATIGKVPATAVAISIPVTEMGLGMELTPMTEIGVDQAVVMVKELVTQ
ncbi:MAG: hydrogenase maturation protease [Acidimicrobiia bacterium]|nr:hydrogenase maturation protease [Acidimicrobiia bacterium]